VCGICSIQGHPTDRYLSLQQDSMQETNVVGGFPANAQEKYDSYSNHYNPGWRDYPNFSYGNQGGQQRQPSQNFTRPPQNPTLTQASNSSMSLEDIVKNLANNSLQFQQNTRTSI
jgi:hypothetical protein